VFGFLLLAACSRTTFASPNLLSQTWQIEDGDDRLRASPDFPVSNWRTYNLGISSEHQWTGSGTFWLRQTFRIPTAWEHEELRCDLRILAREVELFLNGAAVPLKRDAEQTASFVVPAALLRGGGVENHFALRISGPDYTGGLGHEYLTLRPASKTVPSVELHAEFPSADHVYADGRDLKFTVSGRLQDAESTQGFITVRIENEFHRVVFLQRREVGIAREHSSFACEVPSLPAGFYQVLATFTAAGIEAQDVQWFAVAPTEISCPVTAPSDLDEYWRRAKSELAAVAPEFSVQPEPSQSTETHRVYTVAMKSVGGVTLRAWYVVPTREGRFPAVLHVPGYGQAFHAQDLRYDPDIAHLALDVRGHGRSADQVNPGFGTPGYVADHVLDPEHYIYRNAYLDGLRALDFLTSRAEIDASRIAVTGGSQGGGLTIGITALADGRVKCCAAGVPFLGDFMHHLQIRTVYVPEFTEAFKALGRGTFTDVVRTMSYIDIVNLAPWVRCPVLMGSGLFDADCPPHINFAMYNRLGGLKEYRIYPSRPHHIGPEWEPDARAWLRRQFGL